MTQLDTLIQESSYHDYVYSYPHKTAWRPFSQALKLNDVWAHEDTSQLFGYIHIPFCEMRCGFCNLFTSVEVKRSAQEEFVNALSRQIRVSKESIGDWQMSCFAIGGGTPSVLEIDLLERVLNLCADDCGVNFHNTPCSIETSPATISTEKINLLRDRGIERLSIGVQSFITQETHALKRPQDQAIRDSALQVIQDARFSVFNIDLIYGIPDQTAQSFEYSIQQAIDAGANELYLYPLYVRQLTLLGQRDIKPGERQSLYEHGRDYLLSLGWLQESMRCFQAPSTSYKHTDYRCQRDGMLGFGVGARSYTNAIHYSSDFAVRPTAISNIIQTWCQQSDDDFAHVQHGFTLDDNEQKRRFLILTLLDGAISEQEYQDHFHTELNYDFPQLQELADHNLATFNNQTWTLTAHGIALSDTIGHWLFSDNINQLTGCYQAQ